MLKLWTLVIASVLAAPQLTGVHDGGDLVNAVLGNASYLARHERRDYSGRDHHRIRVHLEYVIERLSLADTSHLSPGAQRARTRNLNRLETYTRNGEYPRKPTTMQGRVPCFVDARGAVCAVGYLLEQDLGRSAVLAVAAEHRFDYVP